MTWAILTHRRAEGEDLAKMEAGGHDHAHCYSDTSPLSFCGSDLATCKAERGGWVKGREQAVPCQSFECQREQYATGFKRDSFRNDGLCDPCGETADRTGFVVRGEVV
jgi:hypothetical protein